MSGFSAEEMGWLGDCDDITKLSQRTQQRIDEGSILHIGGSLFDARKAGGFTLLTPK